MKLMNQATVRYLMAKKLLAKLPKAVEATYLAIIPYMAKLDRRWEFVTEENFIPNRYDALKDFVAIIKNLLTSR